MNTSGHFQSSLPWYRQLTGYHWFVLLVAALGWMFDCLDQQLFALGRNSAMTELLRRITADEYQQFSRAVEASLPKGNDSSAIVVYPSILLIWAQHDLINLQNNKNNNESDESMMHEWLMSSGILISKGN